MKRSIRLTIVFMILLAPLAAFAQSGGIKGVLKDEKGNPVSNASVEVTTGGILKAREITDFDGNYSVRPLDGGRYDVKFSFQNHVELVNDVILSDNQIATVDATLETGTTLKVVTVRAKTYVAPIIDRNKPGGSSTKTGDQIDKAPTRNTADIASLSTQVHQSSSGGGLSIAGGRTTGTKYVIDGVQQSPGSTTFTNQNPGNVEAITTFTSGVPARYGDASGGLVTITTRGATSRTQGNVQYEHSLEGYNQNQLTFNLSGPLLRKKDSTGKKGRPLIGYSLTADGIYADDYNPLYGDSYVINADKLYQLEQHPLTLVQTAGITKPQYSTQLVQESDFERTKKRTNAKFLRGNVGGKLDFNLTDNISVRLGANYYANNTPGYDRPYSLYAADQFQRTNAQTGRGYLRLTQKFGNRVDKADLKDYSITNASYTAQVDYQKDYSTTQDPTHKHNTFDYGYVGKFEELYAPSFFAGGIDPLTGKAGVKLVSYVPIGVKFTPGTQNPLLANYTKDYYAYNPNPIQQVDITSDFGLRNGDVPTRTYNLFDNIGTSNSYGWRQSNNDQVGVTVDASFDLKSGRATHSIEFGLYYQQQNQRYYSVSGAGIWGIMRQLTSRVVSFNAVDERNATFIVNGKQYTSADVQSGIVSPGPNDTILYARKFDSSAQGAFDRHLREKLFAMGEIKSLRDYINTDKYDPSLYTLDMFSADDLLNSGKSQVSYYGYDYSGKPVSGQVNFNDFWTKKDAQGYYTRPIGAYRPIYIAGYLSDAIQYKDFNITLGVRVERFDNNTKVLKDPYTFTPAKTASEVQGKADELKIPLRDAVTGEEYRVPGNIGAGYIAYTGDNNATVPLIIGYRNGDVWYDRTGKEVEDPRVLQTGTGANGLQPVLQNSKVGIRDTGFDPNGSFTDYTPQVNAMPRINFSFPLNEDALFYAHYDVMFQRPNTGAFAKPTDYYFVDVNSSDIYGNSNLKPERTIDYEVGFQQRITDESGITISGFYKERKDQIQVRPYLFAYPITYYAYGNRDFSTYKGLSLAYELRRIEKTPISMTINYTLSFTEGTGSSAQSANGGSSTTISGSGLLSQIISAGVPNLRPEFPVDYDSRHNLNAQIDYRYRQGEGPTIGKSHFLENFGAQLLFRARSGEPYTKYANPQNAQQGAANSSQIVGTVNASRLPWHYNFDLNVDKTFPLKWKTAIDHKTRIPGRLSLNIYAYSRNLFNIRDVLSVNGFTGRPDDDGYLTSALGQTVTASQVSPSSFQAQYRAYTNSPYNYGNPRVIFIGARLNF